MFPQTNVKYDTIPGTHAVPARTPSFPSRCLSLWRRIFPRRLWAAEAAALVLGGGVIIAMGLVLHAFDGRPIGEWNFSMNLNSFIALLVTFLWMLLVFPLGASLSQLKWNHFSSARSLHDFQTIDQASRGVVGSLRLCLLRPTAGIAPVAAVLTILITAIGPFTQQVLDIGIVHQPVHAAATVPIANPSFVWSGDSHDQTFNSTSANGAPFGLTTKDSIWDDNEEHLKALVVPPYLSSAMNTGIYSSQYTSFSIQPSCGTSNCSWPPYNMLSFHSQCANITDRIKLNTTIFNMSTSDSNNTMILLPNGNNLTFFGALGTFVQQGTINFTDSLNNTGYLFKTMVISPSETPLVYPDSPDTVLTTEIIYLETEILSRTRQTKPDTAVRVIHVAAMECSMNLKARSMVANMTNGVFSEENKGGLIDANPVQGSAISPRTLVAASAKNESIYDCSYNSSVPSTRPAEFFQDCTGYVVQDVQFNAGGSRLGIGPAAAVSLANSAAKLFDGNGTASKEAGVQEPSLTDSQDIEGLVNYYTSDVMKTFLSVLANQMETNASLRDSNMTLTDVMDNVANSLTVSMRSAANSRAAGIALVQQTVYNVQWPWLSIPIALLVLSSLIVLATAVDTRQKRMPVWTDSSIAVMVHGLAGLDRQNLLLEKNADRLHDASKDIKARLIGNGQTLQSEGTAVKLNWT